MQDDIFEPDSFKSSLSIDDTDERRVEKIKKEFDKENFKNAIQVDEELLLNHESKNEKKRARDFIAKKKGGKIKKIAKSQFENRIKHMADKSIPSQTKKQQG